MESKEKILGKLRRQIVDQVPLPNPLEGDWIEFESPQDKFAEMVTAAGGKCLRVESRAQAATQLAEFAEWKSAKSVFSAIDNIPGTVDLDACNDPHQLENLDFVIYPGQFAVAENGAIWLSDSLLKHRVVFFITQFLVLFVDAKSVVHNMHQAYAQAEIPQPGFGLFLSGPSKTADIEQSLVIGAHGCRELTVFLIDA